MNISINAKTDNDITFDDLEEGTVFLSFNRDYCQVKPDIFMKVVDSSTNNDPHFYVLDLQSGNLYDDVDMYSIDKIIDQDFVINFSL